MNADLINNAINNMNKLTDEQDALLAKARDGNGNITGRALAGSGKTFILKLLTSLWPTKKILYVTFSKLLADEAAQAGLPSNTDIKTAHALAYGSCKKYYSPAGKLNLNDYFRDEAMFEYLKCPMFDEPDNDEEAALVRDYKRTFLSLIAFCKYNMATSLEEIAEVMLYYGIGAEPWMLELLDRARKFSLQPSSTINFTEMVHTPVSLGLPMPKYDIILADEVQDSSLMIMHLYEQCLAPGGRIICVGDEHQAIYGFAGSRNEALDIFTDRFQCVTMPLSVNFRCGKEHIKLAQKLVPDIKAHDNAIEGEVVYSHEPKLTGLVSGDLILCRTNAPLVGPCLALIKQGVKAMIKGKDLAGPIINVLKKVNKLPKSKGLDRIIENEEADMRLADKRKYKKASVDAITERYAIAKMFLMDSEDADAAIKKIYAIFSDKSEGIVFSSVHKSKGLEADNVTILQANKIRMVRSDMLPWQHEQEAHLEYVALTRPKLKLTLMFDAVETEKEADEE